MNIDIVPIWTAILVIAVVLYILLDGFDLGVGILSGLAPPEHRDMIMRSVSPIWDGNETWLILGGMGLFSAFPLAFAIIMPAEYFPLLVMLLALVFRGVSFEFRFKEKRAKWFWDRAFSAGSLLATFAQGIILGSYIHGFKVNGRAFTGGSFDWATPYAFVTGVALVLSYSLLGAGWLFLKTEGPLHDWARAKARLFLFAALVGIVASAIGAALVDRSIAERCLRSPGRIVLATVAVLILLIAAGVWKTLREDCNWGHAWPFVGSLALLAVSFMGLVSSLWPMIVPHTYTLWEAASPASTQLFLLVGTLFLLPIIIMYTLFSYYVFRGKVKLAEGYE